MLIIDGPLSDSPKMSLIGAGRGAALSTLELLGVPLNSDQRERVGFLEDDRDIEDAPFFGMSPREAASVDPYRTVQAVIQTATRSRLSDHVRKARNVREADGEIEGYCLAVPRLQRQSQRKIRISSFDIVQQ